MARLLLLVLLLLAAAPAEPGRPTAEIHCPVHIILFVPADVRPPANYQQRIDDIVTYTEAFFRREMKRWGHDQVVMPFRRAADGRVEVTMVRGKEPAAKYEPVPVRVEVMDAMRKQGRVRGARQLWWILVYAGDPPVRFKASVGGFGPQIGGWGVYNFDTRPGRLDPATPLGAGLPAAILLKGMIHELGHGFGLPHIGPLDRDHPGNTLMGPTHINYRRVRGKSEERVYLSEAEAAMLSQHPSFTGSAADPNPLPTVKVSEIVCSQEPGKRALVVSGRVTGSKRAVYALVADEADSRPGEYWTKTYAGKVAEDGTFRVRVTEPAESGGTLRTCFIFENGAQTGDGRTRSRKSGIPTPYRYLDGKWVFQAAMR